VSALLSSLENEHLDSDIVETAAKADVAGPSFQLNTSMIGLGLCRTFDCECPHRYG